jgi:predicted enzyme related to lactoylglutathione lyase
MARVIGIGGVFFKSDDPPELAEWYREVLGVEVLPWGGAVFTPEPMAAHPGSGTVWSPFPADTDYFEPSKREFMVNLAVDDLDGMVARCAEHGVEVTVMPEEQPNGRFAHLVDPDGTRIELWEPKPLAT